MREMSCCSAPSQPPRVECNLYYAYRHTCRTAALELHWEQQLRNLHADRRAREPIICTCATEYEKKKTVFIIYNFYRLFAEKLHILHSVFSNISVPHHTIPVTSLSLPTCSRYGVLFIFSVAHHMNERSIIIGRTSKNK